MEIKTFRRSLDSGASSCPIDERGVSSTNPGSGAWLCNFISLMFCLVFVFGHVGCVSVDDECAAVEDVGDPQEIENVCEESGIKETGFLCAAHALNTELLKLVGHKLGEVPAKDYLERCTKTRRVAQSIRTRTVGLPDFSGRGFIAKNISLEVDDDFGCVRTIEAFIVVGASDGSVDLMKPFERAIGRMSETAFVQDGGRKRSFWLNDSDSGGHYYLYMTDSSEGIRFYVTCSFNVITML